MTEYVVLLAESSPVIPGGSSACIQLYDSSATRIKSWCFKAGWRNQLTNASMDYSSELAADVIVINSSPVINGRDIRKMYFAVANHNLRFIRMENSNGELVQNEYMYSSYQIGVAPEAKSIEDWTGLLKSADLPDVLSALVYLGGKNIESRLSANPRIREQFRRLTESTSPWIREAAQAALRPNQRPLQ